MYFYFRLRSRTPIRLFFLLFVQPIVTFNFDKQHNHSHGYPQLCLSSRETDQRFALWLRAHVLSNGYPQLDIYREHRTWPLVCYIHPRFRCKVRGDSRPRHCQAGKRTLLGRKTCFSKPRIHDVIPLALFRNAKSANDMTSQFLPLDLFNGRSPCRWSLSHGYPQLPISLQVTVEYYFF